MSEQMFEVLNARFHKNGFELRHSKTQVQTNKPSVANTQRCKSTNENVCLQTQGANLTNDREYCLCLCVVCVPLCACSAACGCAVLRYCRFMVHSQIKINTFAKIKRYTHTTGTHTHCTVTLHVHVASGISRSLTIRSTECPLGIDDQRESLYS